MLQGLQRYRFPCPTVVQVCPGEVASEFVHPASMHVSAALEASSMAAAAGTALLGAGTALLGECGGNTTLLGACFLSDPSTLEHVKLATISLHHCWLLTISAFGVLAPNRIGTQFLSS